MEQTRIRIYRKELPRGAEKEEWEAVLARAAGSRASTPSAYCWRPGRRRKRLRQPSFWQRWEQPGLPLIVIDREAVISGRYPTWEELRIWLGIGGKGCGACGQSGESCGACGRSGESCGDAAAVQAEAPKETGNRQERAGTAMGTGPF